MKIPHEEFGCRIEDSSSPVAGCKGTHVFMQDLLYERDVSDRVQALENQVEELEEALNLIAVTSDVATRSDCPKCDGELERGRNQIGCSSCGHIAAPLE